MVQNITSQNGNKVANQFIITRGGRTYLQSYSSVVVMIEKNKVTLGKDWNYSNTTRKYVYQFLRDNGFYVYSKKDIEQGLKEGTFKLNKRLGLR